MFILFIEISLIGTKFQRYTRIVGKRGDFAPNIACFNRTFFPAQQATSVLLTDISRSLSSFTSVTVFCCIGAKREKDTDRNAMQNLTTVYWSSGLRTNSVSKIFDYLHSLMALSLIGLTLPKRTTSLVWTDPPFLESILGSVFICRGMKFFVTIQDWYPEILFALWPTVPKFLQNASREIQAAIFSSADKIICITDDIRDKLAEMSVKNTVSIENWATPDIQPIPNARAIFWDSSPHRNKCIIKFAGNFGPGCDVDLIRSALPLCQEKDKFMIVFQGKGRKLTEIQRLAQEFENVQLLDWKDREDSATLLSECDVHLITLPAALLGLVFPSKLYGALASGKPVLATSPANSMLRKIVDEWQCGLTAKNAEELAAALDRFALMAINGKELTEMGKRSEAAAISRRRDEAVEKYRKILYPEF